MLIHHWVFKAVSVIAVRPSWRALVVALAMLGLVLVASPIAHADTDQELYARIDGYVEKMMASDRIPGLALAIVREQAIVHQKGFGVACPETATDRGDVPVTPQTPFVLGSMSKAFTALAAMQLVEAGKLALDAPVERYLPWFRVADETASAQITLRHLLHHTSGLPKRSPIAQDDDELAAHVRLLATVDLEFSPGHRHHYSSANYQVLGLIIETVSGEPFGDYVQKHIFQSLGMTNSRTMPPAPGQPGLACGHRYLFSFPAVARLAHEKGRLPTAALMSCAEDLARFELALLNGGRGEHGAVLSAKGTHQLLHGGVAGKGFTYAMGWREGPINGVAAIHHGGIVDNYRGKMILLPEQRAAIVVLTNVSSHMGRATSHRIADGVASILAGKKTPSSGTSLKWLLGGLSLGLLILSLLLIKDAITIRKWRKKTQERLKASRFGRLTLWFELAWGMLVPPLV